jgi:hypothetical protein
MVKSILKYSCAVLLGSVAAASAMAGNVSEKPSKLPAPHITSVSTITTAQHQTITIKGTGFGTTKPYTGDSNFIWARELHSGCPYGGVCWEGGYKKDGDTVTLIVKSWTNTEIVLGGFAGAWNQKGYDFTLHKGYKEQIRVWNWQSNPLSPSTPSAYFTVTIQ